MVKKQATKVCSVCLKDKKLTEFYMSYSPIDADNRVRICKKCMADMVDLDNIDSLRSMLRSVDKPFIVHLWESAKDKTAPIGEYFKLINAKDFRHLNYDHSDVVDGKLTMTKNNESQVSKGIDTETISEEYLEELKEKYGHGFPDEEYILFEKKFLQLKPSFHLATTMHEEYLREYCVNKVKETLAKTKGDFKEAKEWAAMAKESAEAGKLKPSQMSKADLSKGLDGFGQLARMVEQKQDIIPLLPKFIQQPKDKVDIVLWLYVNYVRDLKGLPEAKYEDIYRFYEERRKDYEKQQLDNDPSVQVEGKNE